MAEQTPIRTVTLLSGAAHSLANPHPRDVAGQTPDANAEPAEQVPPQTSTTPPHTAPTTHGAMREGK